MSPQKRLFDIVFALLILPVVAAVALAVALVLLAIQGRPLFYAAERMKTPTQSFHLWKFRTMTVAQGDAGVCGGDMAGRITPIGRVLRRLRLDELPQLWNILRGDISFVGPRPPLRIYVERFPEIYTRVLQSCPGVTGLATIHYYRHEEWLLAQSSSAAQTDMIYTTRCIPAKAKLDLIYARHASVFLDMRLIARTLMHILLVRHAGRYTLQLAARHAWMRAIRRLEKGKALPGFMGGQGDWRFMRWSVFRNATVWAAVWA